MDNKENNISRRNFIKASGISIASLAAVGATPSIAQAAESKVHMLSMSAKADLPKAKEAFSKVVDVYPKSSKTPDALLKLGYTLSAMKEKEKATVVFEKIITSYPSSPAAIKARERLNAR